MPRTPSPPISGSGELTVGREVEGVVFSYHENTGRGSVSGRPELMASAFRRGEGSLSVTEGQVLALNFIAYSIGADTAYFELRKRQSGAGFASPHHSQVAVARRAPRHD